MKKKKWITIAIGWLAVWLAFSLFIPPVFSQGNIHFGKVRIEPGIAYKLEYNDNIYSANTAEEEDFIHTITPTIGLVYEGSRPENSIRAGYSVDLVAYTDFGDNNYETHKPYLSATYKSPMGFYAKVNEAFIQTADPYGDRNTYAVGEPQTERYTNTFDTLLGYEFSRFGVEGSYKNYFIKYDQDDDKFQDKLDHAFGLTFLFKATPKTSILAQYRRTNSEYTEQNDGIDTWNSSNSQDYALNDYFIGARFRPGGKLSGEIKLGYGDKNFENDQDKDGNDYEDDEAWIAETNVGFQITAKTGLSIRLMRLHEGSPDSDAASFISTTLGLDLSQILVNRLSLNAGVEYNDLDYQNEVTGRPEKSFDIYAVKAGIQYDIKDWLFTGLNVTYKSKQASDNQYETDEYDITTLSLSIMALF